MKKVFVFIIISLMFLNASVQAQDSAWKGIARGQSDHGFWVVEVNKAIPETRMVSFYTKDNTLMYKEEVKSAMVNMNRAKSIKRLEQLLGSIAIEWRKSKAIAGSQLVYQHFE